MRWRVGSMRARLTVVAAASTCAVMGAAAAVATWQIDAVTDRALADAAKTRLATISGALDPDAAAPQLPREATYVQVLAADGHVVAASPSLADVPPLLPLPAARRGGRRPALVNLGRPDVDLAAVGAPHRVNGGAGAIVVAVDSQGFLDARRQLHTVVLLGVPLVVLLTALLTWLLTGRSLRAVTRLAEDADALSGDDRGAALSVSPGDAELARLVAALNRMLMRLGTHYATNLAAAAETTHRLRTPLATLRAEAELALMDDDPATARAALERIVVDADRLTTVVDDLLASGNRQRSDGEIRSAVGRLGEQWRRQGAARSRTVEVTTRGKGTIDTRLLAAVADPLVENALRFSEVASPVVVDVISVDGKAVVRVTNRGDGIAPERRDRLFQPWVGQTRGGLGLWLSREAARAGGGDVWCEHPGPPTTTFVAELPLRAAAVKSR
jgi:signal transduction histidine kinase